MRNIEPHISRYIDETVDRAEKRFQKNLDRHTADIKHEMGLYRDAISDDIKKIAEMVNDKPSRTEVREIVRDEMREELRPIRAEMQMYREELLDHRTRIGRLEHARA